MKQVKFAKLALIAAAMAVTLGSALPAAAQNAGEYASDNWQNYYSQMIKPMVAKMNAAEVKKVMDMEMALAKMEASHSATMSKMSMDHKLAVMKMRQDIETFVFFKGNY
jgi:hypothetical protein